jgi:lipopolysaccharide export system permease protein
MRLLYKSILKELLFTFFLGLVALNLVLMSEKVLMFTRLLSSVGASLWDLGVLTIYLQPQITVMTIPMSFLLSTLLTYGRMGADNELVVMRTSGMSFSDASRPVFMLGALCFLICMLLSLYVAPMSSRKLKGELSNLIAQRAPYAIEEGIFNTSFKDIVIFVKNKPDKDTLRDIFIYDERKKNRPTAMFAKEGRIFGERGGGVSLMLRDGRIHIVRGERSTGLSFGKYNFSVSTTVTNPSSKYQVLPTSELLKRAEKSKDQVVRAKLVLEFHRRFSLPFLCLILMLFGPPLSLRAGKTGRLGGLAIGLSVFAVYYSAVIYGENLVRAGKVPHYAGAWAPALVLGLLAVWFFRKTEAS